MPNKDTLESPEFLDKLGNYALAVYESYFNGTDPVDRALKDLKQFLREKMRPEMSKHELLSFLQWYNSLSPSDKVTVHPPAGSGGGTGIYNLSNEQIIEEWERKSGIKEVPEIKFPTEEDLKTFLKNCDPLNQTLEKQADIRFGYLTAIRQLKHLNSK